MADSGINIALDRKTSHHLARLAEVTKEPIQKLAKRLIVEGIECEIEEIALADIVKECEAPGAETIKYEDFEQEWSIYKIELSKRYAKKDFPALSEETKSAIKKAIEEELKVKPTKVGKPLRGKLRGYRRLKFDKYRLIYHVNISKRKVLLVTAGYRDNIYNQAGLLDLLPKL